MTTILSNAEYPAIVDDGTSYYLTTYEARPGGGYSLIRAAYEGDFTTKHSLQNLDASGKPGKPIAIKLDKGFISDVNPLANGNYTVAISDRSSTGIQSISLGTMTANGVLKAFYTAKLQSLNLEDYDTDSDVAFNDAGGIALVRLGGSGMQLVRTVDVFNAQHRKIASVVIDKSMTGDQHQSTKALALSDGNFLVTWVEGNADGASVKAQVVAASGKVIGSNFTVARVDDLPTPADVYIRYKVTPLNNGGFNIAYRGSEEYSNPQYPTSFDEEFTPVKMTNWLLGASGKFVKGADLFQDKNLSNPEIEDLVKLSDGRLLKILKETAKGSDGILLETLHGYIYDQSGGNARDHFEFFTRAKGENYSEGFYDFVAGRNNSIIFSQEYHNFTDWKDSSNTLHVFTINKEAYTTIKGATAGNDTLRGKASGFDLIDGADGNDTLFGLGSSDKLLGGRGDDRLDGGAGIDHMEGGQGNDVYIVDTLGDKVVEARNAGTDLVQSSVTYTLTDNVENLTQTGSGAIRGFGNAQANAITGNSGKNDLYGLAGADVLEGGKGADMLHGGSGGDRFVYKSIADSGASEALRDTIVDFNKASRDKIDLTQIDANFKVSGNQDFDFIGTSDFTKTAGQLHFSYTDTGTLLSGDVTGDGVADFSILLVGRLALSHADFV